MMRARSRMTGLIPGLVVASLVVSAAGAWAATTSQVLAAVKASESIQQVPSNLSPSLTQALNQPKSTTVAGANWILNSCDPYWTHSQAVHPVPCVYGDKASKKTIVLFGDSNAGNWAPALDKIYKALGYKLDLFGFIGCTTAPVTETATSQPNSFPTQWQLCNTWHKSLPAAVRAVNPVAIFEAASPWMTLDANEKSTWVSAMASAFSKMTSGHPRTIRVEMGTTPLFPYLIPSCLASYPTSIQKCSVSYSSPTAGYGFVLARDQKIASAAHATLVPSWQWFCSSGKCSPIVDHYMVMIDRDHTSTPYALYLEGAINSTLLHDLKLH